jgi:hypothetical protein
MWRKRRRITKMTITPNKVTLLVGDTIQIYIQDFEGGIRMI